MLRVIDHFRVPLCLCFKTSLSAKNHSYENEFDLHENETVGGNHFHMNGFALRLVLIQRQEATRKWPIEINSYIKDDIIIVREERRHT